MKYLIMQFSLARQMSLNFTTFFCVMFGKELNVTNEMFSDGTNVLLAYRNICVNATGSVCHSQVPKEEEQVFHGKQQGVRILTTCAA
jgi:hypothetical protein